MLLYNISSTIFLVACLWPRDSQQRHITQNKVTIPQGNLQGTSRITRHHRISSAFLGIPYAKPPIGDLRFADPVAAHGWTGTLNASVDGKGCIQPGGGSEDCLTINVYTPQLPQKSNCSLLPVMVWIYGGAFMTGSHNSGAFGPEYFLDADVVLAVPNYRLGPFGFLSTGDEVASGNWGLKDQVLALQWVQDNIEYFGGDPDRVTLFGESAGAASVHLLTLSDATIGLFHRYITQSGSALATWAYQPRASYASRASELGGYVGCPNDTSASLIACLRELSASDIVASYSHFDSSIPFVPTDEPNIDGAVLTDSPADIFASGKIRDLPWMSGVVRDEGNHIVAAYWSGEKSFDHFLKHIDNELPAILSLTYQSDYGAAWVKAIKSYYFNDLTASRSELLQNLTNVVTDGLFFYPNLCGLQRQLSLAVNPQYFYKLDYRGTLSNSFFNAESSTEYSVLHGDDLVYLFPSDSPLGRFGLDRSESDSRMVDTMVELWTSFAINGTPTTTVNNNTVAWGAYSKEDNYLRIGNYSDPGLAIEYSLLKERMEFWAPLYAANVHTTRRHLRPNPLQTGSKLLSSGYSTWTNALVPDSKIKKVVKEQINELGQVHLDFHSNTLRDAS